MQHRMHCIGSFALRRGLSLRAKRLISSYETLKWDLPSPHVLQCQLNRPDKSNAMSRAFFVELLKFFDEAAADASVRAVVLIGAGKNFCAGLDVQDHASLLMGSKDGCGAGDLEGLGPSADYARKSIANTHFIERYQAAVTALERCPKPVIAAIHGACVGGGVDVICAADVRFASEDAYFCVKEVDLGMAADIGTLQRLPRVVGGDSLARELVFSARRLPAAEAASCGLVSRVLPSKEETCAAALALAAEIATKSPVAIQGSKVNLNYARDHSTGDALKYQALWNAAMLQSADVAAASTAMLTRKQPAFDDL